MCSTRQVKLAIPPSVTVMFWTIGNWPWAPRRDRQKVCERQAQPQQHTFSMSALDESMNRKNEENNEKAKTQQHLGRVKELFHRSSCNAT